MRRFMKRHKVDELRRESQQGLGKPIIGTKFKDYQLVAVATEFTTASGGPSMTSWATISGRF